MRARRRPPTARIRRDRVVGAARRLSPDTWALITIGAAVLLANLLYLLDFSDPNPLGPRSGLLSSTVLGPAGGQPTIDPNNGFASQALGHLAALDLLHLHLPLWNPYAGTVMPLLGETQSAGCFPPTLLTAISNGQAYSCAGRPSSPVGPRASTVGLCRSHPPRESSSPCRSRRATTR